MKDEKRIFAVDKLRTPYDTNGKTNFKLRNKAGVYLIHKKSVLVYVGFSTSDVYKALYRHFEKWKDKSQQRIVFDKLEGIKVRVVYCINATKARKLEGALILKHKPQLNINQYSDFVLDEKDKILIETFEETQPEIYQYNKDLPF